MLLWFMECRLLRLFFLDKLNGPTNISDVDLVGPSFSLKVYVSYQFERGCSFLALFWLKLENFLACCKR